MLDGMIDSCMTRELKATLPPLDLWPAIAIAMVLGFSQRGVIRDVEMLRQP